MGWLLKTRRSQDCDKNVTVTHGILVSNSKASRRLCNTQQNILIIFSDLGMSMINISSHLIKTSDSPRGCLGLRGKRNKVIDHNHSLAACQENVAPHYTCVCTC